MTHSKFVVIGAVVGILFGGIAGCEQANQQTVVVESTTGRVIDSVGSADEVCYKGVVYVNLNKSSDNRSNWGSVKFTSDGKVALCQTVNRNTQ